MTNKCRHCGAPGGGNYDYCPHCKRNHGGAVYPATQTDQELRDIDLLIGQIHNAFDAVPLGGGKTIHQADLESWYDDEDWIAAKAKDPETHWSEVPDWKLARYSSALIFFDAEGWRFYIPAYMCWSLRNWRTSNSMTYLSILWNLGWTDEFSSERFGSLDREQSEMVYDFLEFFDRYSGERDARKAIDAYWYSFKRI